MEKINLFSFTTPLFSRGQEQLLLTFYPQRAVLCDNNPHIITFYKANRVRKDNWFYCPRLSNIEKEVNYSTYSLVPMQIECFKHMVFPC